MGIRHREGTKQKNGSESIADGHRDNVNWSKSDLKWIISLIVTIIGAAVGYILQYTLQIIRGELALFDFIKAVAIVVIGVIILILIVALLIYNKIPALQYYLPIHKLRVAIGLRVIVGLVVMIVLLLVFFAVKSNHGLYIIPRTPPQLCGCNAAYSIEDKGDGGYTLCIFPIERAVSEKTGTTDYTYSSTSRPWLYSYTDKIRVIIIENGIEYLGSYVFKGLKNLEYVELPSSLTEIGQGTFEKCVRLKNVSIPENSKLKIIDDRAFYDCDSLERFEAPGTVCRIGTDAFNGCRSLQSFQFDKSEAADNPQTFVIGPSAFEKCTSLSGFDIPNGLVSIENYTFKECTNLTSVILPDGICRIGDSAFEFCVELLSVDIPDSVEKIGDEAFRNCERITKFDIPRRTSLLGHEAFRDCGNLTQVSVVPNTDRVRLTFFTDTFRDCRKLDKIGFVKSMASGDLDPDYIDSIKADEFLECKEYSVSIPESEAHMTVEITV